MLSADFQCVERTGLSSTNLRRSPCHIRSPRVITNAEPRCFGASVSALRKQAIGAFWRGLESIVDSVFDAVCTEVFQANVDIHTVIEDRVFAITRNRETKRCAAPRSTFGR